MQLNPGAARASLWAWRGWNGPLAPQGTEPPTLQPLRPAAAPETAPPSSAAPRTPASAVRSAREANTTNDNPDKERGRREEEIDR